MTFSLFSKKFFYFIIQRLAKIKHKIKNVMDTEYCVKYLKVILTASYVI